MNYQAILANRPLGYFLTKNFLASSKKRIAMANVKGMKICSTGAP
jgi:hypothetical protein